MILGITLASVFGFMGELWVSNGHINGVWGWQVNPVEEARVKKSSSRITNTHTER